MASGGTNEKSRSSRTGGEQHARRIPRASAACAQFTRAYLSSTHHEVPSPTSESVNSSLSFLLGFLLIYCVGTCMTRRRTSSLLPNRLEQRLSSCTEVLVILYSKVEHLNSGMRVISAHRLYSTQNADSSNVQALWQDGLWDLWSHNTIYQCAAPRPHHPRATPHSFSQRNTSSSLRVVSSEEPC